MKIIPTPVRAAWIRFCQRTFAHWAMEAKRPVTPMAEPVSLHLVISEKTWEMGVLAVRGLEFQTGLRWELFLHDDGSLTDATCASLARLLPGATLLRRPAINDEMTLALAPWPVSQAVRGKHNWFLKYFDTYFAAPHRRYIVLDSDIIFHRWPAEIMDWVRGAGETLHFMEDTRETYASPREDLERAMDIPFWHSVNSGICLMTKEAVDLDLAEKFLSTFSETAVHFMFLEQSLFALTGSAWAKGGTLPRTYEISWNNFRRPDAVCRHYVGPFKNDLFWVEGAFSLWLDLKFGLRRDVPQTR